jgi:hypothetical protein
MAVKFLYCENQEEEQFENILEENDWLKVCGV